MSSSCCCLWFVGLKLIEYWWNDDEICWMALEIPKLEMKMISWIEFLSEIYQKFKIIPFFLERSPTSNCILESLSLSIYVSNHYQNVTIFYELNSYSVLLPTSKNFFRGMSQSYKIANRYYCNKVLADEKKYSLSHVTIYYIMIIFNQQFLWKPEHCNG